MSKTLNYRCLCSRSQFHSPQMRNNVHSISAHRVMTCSNGLTSNQVGNTEYFSNGTIRQSVGPTDYYSRPFAPAPVYTPQVPTVYTPPAIRR